MSTEDFQLHENCAACVVRVKQTEAQDLAW
jgi:hypothetical protein